jgi:hypothetical protein
MKIVGADIDIDNAASSDEVAAGVISLAAGSAFRLAGIETIAAERYRCTFDLATDGLVVGFRNVIDLQHRINREFDIVSVERRRSLIGY